MLNSADDRFSWSRRDRIAEVSFFRVLQRNWRPMTRRIDAEEHPSGYRRVAVNLAESHATKPVWSPWLWIKD